MRNRDYENLLKRVEELEAKNKQIEDKMNDLMESNRQLAEKVSKLITILLNNGISLSSKDKNISSDDIDKSIDEADTLNNLVDDAIKEETQEYEDIYSDSSFLKNESTISDEEVDSVENPEIIELPLPLPSEKKGLDSEKQSDTQLDDEYENPVDTTSFNVSSAREDLLNKYYSYNYSDSEEDSFEKSENDQESMVNIDNLNENNDNDEISLDDTNNDYLGAPVVLNYNLDPKHPTINPENPIIDPEEQNIEQEVNYEKGKGKKTSKIKNIRKAFNWENIKKGIKKHWKKVVAATLVATATVSALVSCANNNKRIDEDNANIIQENNADFPSKSAANEFGVNTDDVLNNLNNQKQDKSESSEKETYQVDIDSQTKNNEEKNTDIDTNYQASEKTYNVTSENFSIGQDVNFTGEYIYQTSKDASSETNKLNPYYTNNDKRSISAIQMVSPDGTQHVTITDENKDEQNLLESMGWSVESYNISNDTRNIEYEGWINNSDLEVSNGNHR